MNEQAVVEKLEKEIVPLHARVLSAAAAELREKELDSFNKLVNFLSKRVLAALLQEIGGKSANDLTKKLQCEFLVNVISQFNAVLPLDHPFIVVGLDLQDEPGMTITTVRRSLISLTHELQTPGVIPIAFAESREAFLSGNLKFRSEWA